MHLGGLFELKSRAHVSLGSLGPVNSSYDLNPKRVSSRLTFLTNRMASLENIERTTVQQPHLKPNVALAGLPDCGSGRLGLKKTFILISIIDGSHHNTEQHNPTKATAADTTACNC